MSENATLPDKSDEEVGQEQAGGVGAEGQSEVESGKDKQSPYLGTWKQKEDAEKGLQELQKTLSRYQSERDQYRSEVEKLNSQVLAKLADSITQRGEEKGQSQADIEAEIEKAASEIENGGGKAAIQWMSRYAMDARSKAKAEVLKELEPKLKAIEEKLNMQVETSIKRDPEYQARSKILSILEESGIKDPEIALKIAKKMQPKVQPERPPLPGNGVGDRARQEDDESMSSEQEAMIEAELNKHFKKPMTAAEKKSLAKVKVLK